MVNTGNMIINGKTVKGRTLSFGDEGVKVIEDGEETVVVPKTFDFAEEAEVTESDFADVDKVNK